MGKKIDTAKSARRKEHYRKNREHERAQQAAYRAANREKINAQKRAHQQENKVALAENTRQRQLANPEHYRSRLKAYRERNAERIRVAKKEWNKRNPYPARKRAREWAAANPEKMRTRLDAWIDKNRDRWAALVIAKGHRRRARLRDGVSRGVTVAEWREILTYFDHRCAYCLRRLDKLEREHVIAVALGGRDEPENVVPSCRRCNHGKGAKSFLTWAIENKVGIIEPLAECA